MLKIKALGILFAMLIAGSASAATIDDGVLRGEIVSGDAQRLVDYLLSVEGAFANRLIVDSPGGLVNEAIRMAKIIKFMHLMVKVEKNANCASACFFLFLGGSPRFAAPAEFMDETPVSHNRTQSLFRTMGFVGLHRPYLRKIEDFKNKQAETMRDVSTYLEGELFPRRLLDLMMSRPSNDIYWLSDADLVELGEYSPEQEEFLIQKCGYDRKYPEALSRAIRRRDRASINRINSKEAQTEKCIAVETNRANRIALGKLRAGWRPN